MTFQVNYKAGKPVYLQLVDQIRLAVASGSLRPGDALPTIRPMAEELRINRNTVAKAYAELENQAVIETVPGKGCFVKPNHSPFKKEVRRQMLTTEIDQAIVQAHHLQIGKDEFLQLARQRFEFFEQKARAATPKIQE